MTTARLEALVVDFDSTCTEEDTSPLLVELAAEAAAEAGEAAALHSIRERWAALVASYIEGSIRAVDQALEEALHAHPPRKEEEGEPRTPNVAGLRLFLERMSAFDLKAATTVSDERVLRGITRERIRTAATRDVLAPLRPGCRTVLEKIAACKIPAHVLSVNWSKDLVTSALPILAGAPLCIRCNDLEFDDGGVSTGRILGDIHTALDKERVISEIFRESSRTFSDRSGDGSAGSAKARERSASGLTAYIGDSVTDLLALARADVGIVIGQSSTLRRVAAAFDLRLVPLPPALPAEDHREGLIGSHGGALLEADSWADIESFLLSSSPPEGPNREGNALLSPSSSSPPPSPSPLSSSFSSPVTLLRCSPLFTAHHTAPSSLSARIGSTRGDAAAHPSTLNSTCARGGSIARGEVRVLRVVPRAGEREGVAFEAAAPEAGGPREEEQEDLADVAKSDLLVEARGTSVPRVLAIAGSDSGGGAGIQADVKACAARGAFCATAISALTAQNTNGVQGVHVIPSHFLAAQMQSVLSDMGADVVKTGMLPSPEIIHTVCDVLALHTYRALVVDPVMVATSGDVLAGEDVLQALRDRLLPLADLVTPNLPEACRILGEPVSHIRNLDDARRAARAIHAKGPRFVLVKGGHFEDEHEAVDILFDGEEYHELRAPRVRTRNTHGTGCTLASAIAAELAKGAPMLAAVKAAKEYVSEALEESKGLRIGRGAQGPMNHFFPLAAWGASAAPGPPPGSGWPTPGSPRWRFRGSDLFLYAVTDSSMNAKWNRTNEDAIAAAIEGGATFLQLREKHVDTGAFVREALCVVARARAAGVPLVINDRIDVALASGADGVHIGQSDMPVALARRLLGPDRILGVSCKTPAHALQAAADGADYIGCGGVFPTNTKKNNLTIGIDGLLTVCRESPIPAVAIGGIKAGNAGGVLTAGRGGPGPCGIAIVSGVFDQPDVALATRQLSTALQAAVAAMADEAGGSSAS